LLSRLSGLGLFRRLPKLKYQKDLVCAPCRHGKMVAASHPPDICYDREAMRAVPYGLGWSSSCVLGGWEMVCPCDHGQLFSLCLGLLLSRQRGDVWFCSGYNLDVEE
jgi:hypothetical protein